MIPTGNFKVILLSKPSQATNKKTTAIVGIPPSRNKTVPLQLELNVYSKQMQETLNNGESGQAFFLSNTKVRHDPTGERTTPEGKKQRIYSYSLHGGLLTPVSKEVNAFPNINQIYLFGWCGFDPTEKDLIEINQNLVKAKQSVSVLMSKDEYNNHMIEQLSSVDDTYNAAMQLHKWAKKRKPICVRGSLATTKFTIKDGTEVTKTVVEVDDFKLGSNTRTDTTSSNNNTFRSEESIGDAWAEPAKARSVAPLSDTLGNLPGQWDSSPRVPETDEVPF